MIIEISDIPQGKIINHINIDITFDDVKGTIVEIQKPLTSERMDELLNELSPEPGEASEAKPADFQHTRETKPIPEEMKDITF